MNNNDGDSPSSKREFEEKQLQLVLNTISRQINGARNKLSGQREEQRNVGRKDFSGGAVVAWKYASARERLGILESMQNAPYFGRINFIEDNYTEIEIIYIGRTTLTDERDNFLIYDWRAPISSMYYQFKPGAASFQAPMGRICGKMTLKRSYEIENGQIKAIYDADGNVEDGEEQPFDEMLAVMLQRNSTGKMRQIVQSIQSEQDTIVRNRGDVVVVQGPAGSGKTVIALHRAAYLLYHMRLERERLSQHFENVSAQSMVVFSPNSMFSDYISRVLPDLHEGQIRQVVIGRLLEDELRKRLRHEVSGAGYNLETKEEHHEYVLEASDRDYQIRSAGAKIKRSVAMLTGLEQLFQQLETEVEAQFSDILIDPTSHTGSHEAGNVFYGEQEMRRIFRSQNDARPLVQRIDAVIAELREQIVGAKKNNLLIRPETIRHLEKSYGDLRDRLKPLQQNRLLPLYVALWSSSTVLEDALRDNPRSETNEAQDISSSAEPIPAFILEQCARHTVSTLQAKHILYEDIVPLLLLSGLFYGFPTIRGVSHAVVDEAQDYSPLYYEYIRRCLPDGCGLTIVGDVHQATNSFISIKSFNELNQIFPRRVTQLELTRSYRASLEITEFARRILPGCPLIDNVRQTGNKPKLVRAAVLQKPKAIATIIRQLSESGYKSVAVICKTCRESLDVYKNIRNDVPAILITAETQTFERGIVIMPLLYAKGLEFDAVIVNDVSSGTYAREDERNALYTACTRALHELYLCYEGEVTHLVPDQHSDLYEYIAY